MASSSGDSDAELALVAATASLDQSAETSTSDDDAEFCLVAAAVAASQANSDAESQQSDEGAEFDLVAAPIVPSEDSHNDSDAHRAARITSAGRGHVAKLRENVRMNPLLKEAIAEVKSERRHAPNAAASPSGTCVDLVVRAPTERPMAVVDRLGPLASPIAGRPVAGFAAPLLFGMVVEASSSCLWSMS